VNRCAYLLVFFAFRFCLSLLSFERILLIYDFYNGSHLCIKTYYGVVAMALVSSLLELTIAFHVIF